MNSSPSAKHSKAATTDAALPIDPNPRAAPVNHAKMTSSTRMFGSAPLFSSSAATRFLGQTLTRNKLQMESSELSSSDAVPESVSTGQTPVAPNSRSIAGKGKLRGVMENDTRVNNSLGISRSAELFPLSLSRISNPDVKVGFREFNFGAGALAGARSESSPVLSSSSIDENDVNITHSRKYLKPDCTETEWQLRAYDFAFRQMTIPFMFTFENELDEQQLEESLQRTINMFPLVSGTLKLKLNDRNDGMTNPTSVLVSELIGDHAGLQYEVVSHSKSTFIPTTRLWPSNSDDKLLRIKFTNASEDNVCLSVANENDGDFKLRQCRAVLTVEFNHALCDVFSAKHFISTWSKFYSKDMRITKPKLERQLELSAEEYIYMGRNDSHKDGHDLTLKTKSSSSLSSTPKQSKFSIVTLARKITKKRQLPLERKAIQTIKREKIVSHEDLGTDYLQSIHNDFMSFVKTQKKGVKIWPGMVSLDLVTLAFHIMNSSSFTDTSIWKGRFAVNCRNSAVGNSQSQATYLGGFNYFGNATAFIPFEIDLLDFSSSNSNEELKLFEILFQLILEHQRCLSPLNNKSVMLETVLRLERDFQENTPENIRSQLEIENMNVAYLLAEDMEYEDDLMSFEMKFGSRLFEASTMDIFSLGNDFFQHHQTTITICNYVSSKYLVSWV